MEIKAKKIKQAIFIFLEILMNVISLIILPKPNEFINESLKGVKRLSIAIIVFGCLKSFLHLIKIIIFLCYMNNESSLNTYEGCIFVFETYFNIPALIIIWSITIGMIVKLDDYYNHEERSKTIGMVVLYSLSYVFIFLQYVLLENWDCCDKYCEEQQNHIILLK